MSVENSTESNDSCACGAKLEPRETDCIDCVRRYLGNLVKNEKGWLALRDLRDFYDRNKR